jgi:hypothetical protein
VAPLRFDRSRIEELLRLAADQLEGDWLLIGGGAAAAWFSPARTTEDLDLIGLGGTQAERFALMDFAVAAGIPVEAVNSAADFFVRRIPDWRDRIAVLVRGARGTIYRPDPTLFLLLKLGRLSAVDLEDCIRCLAHCREHAEVVDRERVRTALAATQTSDDAALLDRRRQLTAQLDEP